MRRFTDKHGDQYDELPNGLLRRRLRKRERHPGYPQPETVKQIEARVGPLHEQRSKEHQ